MERKMTIRDKVLSGDVQRVREILQSTGFFHPDEIKVAEELVQDGTHAGSEYRFLFVEENGEVVGFTCYGQIALTRSSFDLYWIAVSRSCQSKGIGRYLLETTEGAIRSKGGTRVYIETSSRELYESTRAFYLAQGYEEAAILTDFYAPGDDKVMYVKVF